MHQIVRIDFENYFFFSTSEGSHPCPYMWQSSVCSYLGALPNFFQILGIATAIQAGAPTEEHFRGAKLTGRGLGRHSSTLLQGAKIIDPLLKLPILLT